MCISVMTSSKFVIFLLNAWSPGNQKTLVSHFSFLFFCSFGPLVQILFYFNFFKKGDMNVDIMRKINQWFWNECVKNRTCQKSIFEFLIILKRHWKCQKWRKYIKNIFFRFFVHFFYNLDFFQKQWKKR